MTHDTQDRPDQIAAAQRFVRLNARGERRLDYQALTSLDDLKTALAGFLASEPYAAEPVPSPLPTTYAVPFPAEDLLDACDRAGLQVPSDEPVLLFKYSNAFAPKIVYVEPEGDGRRWYVKLALATGEDFRIHHDVYWACETRNGLHAALQILAALTRFCAYPDNEFDAA